jgi:hypothetical protein
VATPKHVGDEKDLCDLYFLTAYLSVALSLNENGLVLSLIVWIRKDEKYKEYHG